MNKAYLNKEETAEYLGVASATVQHWVTMRSIPHFKVGKHLRFKIADLEKWVESKRVALIN